MGNFLSTAQKHNRQNFEHNRPGPTYIVQEQIGLAIIFSHEATQILMSYIDQSAQLSHDTSELYPWIQSMI